MITLMYGLSKHRFSDMMCTSHHCLPLIWVCVMHMTMQICVLIKWTRTPTLVNDNPLDSVLYILTPLKHMFDQVQYAFISTESIAEHYKRIRYDICGATIKAKWGPCPSITTYHAYEHGQAPSLYMFIHGDKHLFRLLCILLHLTFPKNVCPLEI